jgi:hypothetical protein
MLAAAGAIESVMTTADSKMAKISLRICSTSFKRDAASVG